MRNLLFRILAIGCLGAVCFAQQTPAPAPDAPTAITSLQSRISALESQLKTQTATAQDTAALKSQIDDLKTQMSAATARQADLGGRLAETQQELSARPREQDVRNTVASEVSRLASENANSAIGKIEDLILKTEQQNDADDSSEDIQLRRTILDPKHVSDIFGRRIGKRFIAFQVTVMNRRKDLQLRIEDISLNLCHLVLTEARDTVMKAQTNQEKAETVARAQRAVDKGYCVASSQELGLLRGVAEKGQSLDPRNLTLHALQATGSILGAVVPASAASSAAGSVSNMFAKGVAVFNGPGLTAYSSMFPDYSVTQSQRLSDLAYAANAIVAQQQSRVLVAFVPQSLLMNSADQSSFWKDPNQFEQVGKNHLTDVYVQVKAQFIVSLEDTPPEIDTVNVAPEEMRHLFDAAFAPAKGVLRGKFLGGSVLTLTGPGADKVTLRQDTTVDDHVDFALIPKARLTEQAAVTINVAKKSSKATKDVTLQAPAP